MKSAETSAEISAETPTEIRHQYIRSSYIHSSFLNTPRFLDETTPVAWRLGSALALVLAVIALAVSAEFSLVNLGLSLIAGLVSLVVSSTLLVNRRFPRGIFAAWIVLLASVWLSPLAQLEPFLQRLVFSFAFCLTSLVYQGGLTLYLTMAVLSFGASLQGLSADLTGADFVGFFFPPSVLTVFIALGSGVAILFARISQTRADRFQTRLRESSDGLEQMRTRLVRAQDGIQLTRERLLGRTLPGTTAHDPIAIGETTSDTQLLELHTASFETVITELRKSFADFQTRGRADGRIAGPIRFVFFAPMAGYDEKSTIAVDLEKLLAGLQACLILALESLPEVGARRREGVIRLSVRYGLRSVEIAVEDNGRGLSSRNPQAEEQLSDLKDAVLMWGGRLDRLVRLGVGSRTSMELRIVRERSRAIRATLRHSQIVGSQLESATNP